MSRLIPATAWGQGQSLAIRAAEVERDRPAVGGFTSGVAEKHRRLDPCEDCGDLKPATALRFLPGDRLRRCAACAAKEKRRRGP